MTIVFSIMAALCAVVFIILLLADEGQHAVTAIIWTLMWGGLANLNHNVNTLQEQVDSIQPTIVIQDGAREYRPDKQF